jgi:PIN domain nuclease of toxin-antitoxin system
VKYLLDTHTIYWFFENPQKLGRKSLEILNDKDTQLLILSIVMAELKYIFRKYKILDKFKKVFANIIADCRCLIIPLDENIIERMPTDLEMHDSIIIASAKYFKEEQKEEVFVITQDERIRNSGIVKTMW